MSDTLDIIEQVETQQPDTDPELGWANAFAPSDGLYDDEEEIMDFKTLPPERKIEILGEMGFVAVFDDHQPDCAATYAAGTRCICVPPGTSWSPPSDVQEHMHETFDELRDQRKAGKV